MMESLDKAQRVDVYANMWLKILVRLAIYYVDFSESVADSMIK
jgi:hypothetical protein